MRNLLAGALFVALASLFAPAFAANAEHPETNVDKTNDKGGSTGNDKTEELNRAQQTPPPAPKPAPTPK